MDRLSKKCKKLEDENQRLRRVMEKNELEYKRGISVDEGTRTEYDDQKVRSL